MPGTPQPLWPGYDDASDDDLLALLDEKERAGNDDNDDTVQPDVAGGLATAIAQHEAIKRNLDPDNYRSRVHERASAIAGGGWRPSPEGWRP
jgi:hypothetical protein